MASMTPTIFVIDDDPAVRDSLALLIGTQGLRLIDASAMPRITSGNTNAPVMMIAERGAELVLAAGRGA